MGDKEPTQREALEQAQEEFKKNPPKDERPPSPSELIPPAGLLLAGKPMRGFTAGDARLLDQLTPKLRKLDETDLAVLVLFLLTRENIPELLEQVKDPAQFWKDAQAWMFTIDAAEMFKHIPLLAEIDELQEHLAASDDDDQDVKKKTGLARLWPFKWPSWA